jgi:formate dehydrogenase (NADP+) beta subunit
MRSQIPKFRLPDEVIDEEVGYVLDGGVAFVAERRIDSLKALLHEGYDAIFVGSGAPRGRDLSIPGRTEAAANIRIGIDWLASVSFGHTHSIGRRVIVLGGGNTAMDCCRSSLRLGGAEIKVVVRSGFEEMKASAWEKEDAIHEGVAILNYHVPKAFLHDNGKLTGMAFEKVAATKDASGRRILSPTGEPEVHIDCDDVLIAVGQENAFPWIDAGSGVEFDRDGLPKLDPLTFQSSQPSVFFGGDSAFGPKNIITAVAHGHEAAISIDSYCRGEDTRLRPPPMTNLMSQKMGIHEWSYDNAITVDARFKVPHRENAIALKNIATEVELGFDPVLALAEAQRCLNCDVQTVFSEPICIECDACVDICPVDCISFVPDAPEEQLRQSLNAPAHDLSQAIYVSQPVKTGRIMAKDEDLCLHCGLCAERCPTAAWDMQKFTIEMAQAGQACLSNP